MRDDRAVSSAVGYTLMVVIALALTTGLVFGTESMIENQQRTVVRDQLEIIGEELAATVMTVDRFDASATEPEKATVVRQFPARVAGSQYRVELVENAGTGRVEVRLEAVDVDVSVRVPIRNTTKLRLDNPVNGGTLRVAYDTGENRIEIRNE